MPGKVNPVMAKAATMVVAQVIGNDATITIAGAAAASSSTSPCPCSPEHSSVGRLPRRLLRLLAEPVGVAQGHQPITVRRGLAVGDHPAQQYVGYEAAAKIAKQALADGATIRETVDQSSGYVERGELTEEQLDEALDVESMTHP